jgi:hypothetical protein
MASSQQPQPLLATPSDEDYNQPSQERQEVLQRLQNAIGDVPACFWAACHVCDLGELTKLASIVKIKPSVIRMLARDTLVMVAKCELLLLGSLLCIVVTNHLQGINPAEGHGWVQPHHYRYHQDLIRPLSRNRHLQSALSKRPILHQRKDVNSLLPFVPGRHKTT